MPLFIKKPWKGEKINLIENRKNISNATELCNISMVFFLILFPNLTYLKSIIVIEWWKVLFDIFFWEYLQWCSNESHQQLKCSQKLSNKWYTDKYYQNE